MNRQSQEGNSKPLQCVAGLSRFLARLAIDGRVRWTDNATATGTGAA